MVWDAREKNNTWGVVKLGKGFFWLELEVEVTCCEMMGEWFRRRIGKFTQDMVSIILIPLNFKKDEPLRWRKLHRGNTSAQKTHIYTLEDWHGSPINHPFRNENDLPNPYDYVNLPGCTQVHVLMTSIWFRLIQLLGNSCLDSDTGDYYDRSGHITRSLVTCS